MSQYSDSKRNIPQAKNGKFPHSEAVTIEGKNPCLKLVVSNTIPTPEKSTPTPEARPAKSGFQISVHKKGENLYEIGVEDATHGIACDLILEIEKIGGMSTVICHFPAIFIEEDSFLEADDTLYITVMVQFQMKALEQLFLFCAHYGASQLTLFLDDSQAIEAEIYEHFLIHRDGFPQRKDFCQEGKTEISIPVTQENFTQWLVFMAETNQRLEQELWREQKLSWPIRQYLMTHCVKLSRGVDPLPSDALTA